jgi:hypothetical protein
LLVLPIIDTGRIKTKLRASNRGYITSRAGTDYDHIKFISHN